MINKQRTPKNNQVANGTGNGCTMNSATGIVPGIRKHIDRKQTAKRVGAGCAV